MEDQIKIINPLTDEKWDDRILSHPDYSFFHSSSWAKVLFESYGYTPAYFKAFARGQLPALLPVMEINSKLTAKRGVSLPFSDYSNPLANGDIEIRILLDRTISYGKRCGWKSLELRIGNSLLPSTLPSLTYVGHMLDLDGTEDQIASHFRGSTKRNIKKAIKEGVEVKITDSPDSLREFYRLNCQTRREHGLPPQPYDFFMKIHQHVLQKGLGFIVLATYNGTAIAGSIFFHFGRKAIFKYGASDRNYLPLRANNLVMWEAIRHYAQKGYQSLCFGRTEMENQGLLQFKSSWGAAEYPIQYYRYDFGKETFVRPSSRVAGWHNKIFRSMPLPVLNKIGTVLYRHMG
jgi:hypothetical protein